MRKDIFIEGEEPKTKRTDALDKDLFVAQDTHRQLSNKKHKVTTNKQGSMNDTAFNSICTFHNITPTARQYSKFRRGLGIAYKKLVEERNVH
jgi:hypothetical protein